MLCRSAYSARPVSASGRKWSTRKDFRPIASVWPPGYTAAVGDGNGLCSSADYWLARRANLVKRMSIHLYLVETKARSTYVCPGCRQPIPKGATHFRHDPHPFARQFRGQPTTHWCRDCILASQPGSKDPVGRIRIPAFRVLGRPLSERGHVDLARGGLVQSDLPLFRPLEIQLVRIDEALLHRLAQNPTGIHGLSPAEFEEFVCDRLVAMGFEPRRVGSTNRKDGGVDIVFWPRGSVSFPFLGAAQVKHHRVPRTHEGPSTVRDFAGTLHGHPFNAGLIVTNTSFTPDAKWFASQHAKLVRLRDFDDIRRWIAGSFAHEAEWREIPKSIELCPGVVVKIR